MSTSSVEARKILLERELARYVDILASQENLEKVIVFGSVAAGEIHEWSDIDLVIIQQTASPFFARLREIRQLLQPTVGTDVLVYTPGEFEQMCRERDFMREEILGKGRTIYERNR
jgi:predicted nucleotidyltransferase